MGTAGLVYLKYTGDDLRLFKSLPSHTGDIFLISAGIASLIFLLLYFKVNVVVKQLEKIPALKKFVIHLTLLNNFSRKQLLRILFLSFFKIHGIYIAIRPAAAGNAG